METENMKTDDKKTTHSQGRKMSRGQIIIAVIAVIILVAIGWVNKQPFSTGAPFLVTVEGIQIVPGKTTVQDLLDTGLVVGESDISKPERVFIEYDSTAKLDKKSYINNVYLNKGEQTAAHIEITNFSPNVNKPLVECVVTKVDVWPNNAEQFNILIDETPYFEFTSESIMSIYQEAEIRSSSTVVQDKNYQLTFDMENDEIQYISSSYDKTK